MEPVSVKRTKIHLYQARLLSHRIPLKTAPRSHCPVPAELTAIVTTSEDASPPSYEKCPVVFSNYHARKLINIHNESNFPFMFMIIDYLITGCFLRCCITFMRAGGIYLCLSLVPKYLVVLVT